MKKMKKWSVLLVLMLLFSIILMGCQAPQEVVEEESANVVTDMLGREVTLPDEINTIATPNVDAFRVILQLGGQDKLIGVPSDMYDSKFSQVDTIEVIAWPKVKEIEKVGGGQPNTEINIESLIKLNPDVIISWSTGSGDAGTQDADLLQEKTMIPVLCINNFAQGKSGSLEAVEATYQMMGQITGQEERAAELVDYYKAEMKTLTSVIEKNNPDPDPARFYMSGPGTLLSANNSYLPLKQLGLENVALEIGEKGGDVTKEQLIAWDPALIFSHTPSKVHRVKEEEFQDPILSPITAIEDDHVYRLKGTFMGWDIATGLIDSNIIAKAAYPDLFADVDMEKKGEEILKTFYTTDGLYVPLKEGSDLPSFK